MTQEFKGYRVESARYRDWDYRHNGYYFVTICTHERQPCFCTIEHEHIVLSALGQIVQRCWLSVPAHHVHVGIDAWVIMPNHVHGIIILDHGMAGPISLESAGATERIRTTAQAIAPKAGSLASVVRSFKAAVTKIAREQGCKWNGWQARYWDRIIRNDDELLRIREYIVHNPKKWELERDNPENLWM